MGRCAAIQDLVKSRFHRTFRVRSDLGGCFKRQGAQEVHDFTSAQATPEYMKSLIRAPNLGKPAEAARHLLNNNSGLRRHETPRTH